MLFDYVGLFRPCWSCFNFQRWIYRIDPKRVNEYGQVMAADADTAVTSVEKATPADENRKKETKKTQ